MTRSLREFTYVAVALAGALTYLGVPAWNSVLITIALLSQCAAGALILDRILGNFGTTPLHLLGPGLVVGSALSFAVFNAVGRGPFGLLAVCLLGYASLLLLLTRSNRRVAEPNIVWLLVQLVGLASLSLSWEFPEMLPVAIACLLIGSLTSTLRIVPRLISTPLIASALLVLLVLPFLRQDYWWIVTDDYSFFAMLSQHLTRSGPFATWGNVSFVRYHWLSYGWSGLLNELGGRPGTLMTLSLVVPFAYSLSLGASLVLVSKRLKQQPLTIMVLIPVWAVVAANILDWSGTSTAGVYAVNATAIAVAVTSAESTKSVVARFAVYGGVVIITAVTKLASVFAIAFVFLATEVFRMVRTRRKLVGLAAIQAGCVLGTALVLPAIWITGRLTNGFSIVRVNPGLGQLSTLGAEFTLISLAIQRLWIIVPLVVLVATVVLRSRGESHVDLSLLILGLAPLVLMGLVLDLIVSGDSAGFEFGETNRFQYFSGPMYFFGSVAMLSIAVLTGPHNTRPLQSRLPMLLTSFFLAFGILWEHLGIAKEFWDLFGGRYAGWNDLTIQLLQFVSADSRIAPSITVLPLIPLLFRMRPTFSLALLNSLVASILAITMYSRLPTTIEEYRRERSETEIAMTIGTESQRSIGAWLRSNSEARELIATNDLFDATGKSLSSDFSLAVWSERQFLVVGPALLRVFGPISDEIRISHSFGIKPSTADAERLRERGVSWFIVKRSATLYDEWESNWDVPFSNEHFLVVRL